MMRVLPFKSLNLEKGKSTRKRREVDMKNGNFFPPEGHVSVSTTMQGGGDIESYTCLYFGGARRLEESSWADGREFFEIEYCVSKDDVFINEITKFDTLGSQFPSLQSASAVKFADKVYVWGGLQTSTLQMSNELYVLNKQNNKYNVKLVPISNPTDTTVTLQTGTIPEARSGHSMTILLEHFAVVHGGVSMPNRHTCSLNSPFQQACTDGNFYLLDLENFKWKSLNVPAVQARAYHTATSHADSNSLYIIGGVTFTAFEPTHRLPIDEILVLKFLSSDECVLSNVKFTMPPDNSVYYLSYHSANMLDNKLYIFGGYSQYMSDMKEKPGMNQYVLVYDMTINALSMVPMDDIHNTAGNSSLVLANDCFMIVGGCNKNFYVYTSKLMKPNPCDLQEKCVIEESPEISPISWVQCEGKCKRWLHQHCVGVLESGPPKGKYFCSDCKPSRKRKAKK